MTNNGTDDKSWGQNPLTVDGLIRWLKQTKHRKIAKVYFRVGDKEFKVKSIGQFGIMPDVFIVLRGSKEEELS